MPTYTAPLRDLRFVQRELFNLDDIRALPGCEEITDDLVDAILEEGAKFTSEVLAPLNRPASEEGCHYENGVVRTPKGFKEAYRTYVDGGWGSLSCDPQYGGQGLPAAVEIAMVEMLCSSNLSFGTYPGLTHGAYLALKSHASDELKDFYLPKMVSGQWTGTMCLTEPHCGTDLGLMRTKAVPQADGSHAITGTKIFITAGEHDMAENIIHLVLARLPDAPKGIKGVSLFLVPKFLPNADGSVGPRNGVMCGSIEHKMGIAASATCVMNFEEAKGWIVGAPGKGMQAMFTMMNNERLTVGVQGMALAESSYQAAVAYARERLQGRSISGTKHPDKPADPIIVHPDIRKNLLTIRAFTEGARAIAMWVARELDTAKRHPDPAQRQAADDLVQLLTPMVKAFFTDYGFDSTNIGMQVFGGSGFIRETGVEQFVRDARIAQIYEGANGIQALDLIGRKMPAHAGRYLRRYFHPILNYIEAKQEDPALTEFILPLAKAFGRLQRATGWLAQEGMKNPDEAGAAASDYLHLFGLTTFAYIWTRMAETALPKIEGDSTGFYKAKVETARFFMQRILPKSSGLFSAITAGGGAINGFDEAAF